jgi:putative thioredoxin
MVWPLQDAGSDAGKAVTEARGKVRMVKLNVDECQQIAAQLRIQSIPTVYAFWQGSARRRVPGRGARVRDQGLRRPAVGPGRRRWTGRGAGICRRDADAGGGGRGRAGLRPAILGEEPENAAAYGGLVRAQDRRRTTRSGRGVAGGGTCKDRHLARNRSCARPDRARASGGKCRPGGRPARSGGPRSCGPRRPGWSLRRRFTRQVRSRTLWTNFWKSSAATGNGTMGAAKTQLFIIFDALPPKDPDRPERAPPPVVDDICLNDVARYLPAHDDGRRPAGYDSRSFPFPARFCCRALACRCISSSRATSPCWMTA